jgi:hypothetical protein
LLAKRPGDDDSWPFIAEFVAVARRSPRFSCLSLAAIAIPLYPWIYGFSGKTPGTNLFLPYYSLLLSTKVNQRNLVILLMTLCLANFNDTHRTKVLPK